MCKDTDARNVGGTHRPRYGWLAWPSVPILAIAEGAWRQNELAAGIRNYSRPEWALRYAAAVLAVAMAFGLRIVLAAWIGPGLPPYITFYPAITIVILLAGLGPGLLATALTALILVYWILPPKGFAIGTQIDLFSLVLFSGVGLLLCIVAELYRRNQRMAAAYERELALRESQDRLTLAVSGTQIGMYDWNIATGEALWTEQVAKLLGLRTTTAPARTTAATLSQRCHYRDWAERIYPEDLPRVETELRRCMAEHIPYEAQYRVIWPEGSVHWILDRGIFQPGSLGQCTRMLGILVDITERKRTEEALQELNATLECKVAQRTAQLERRNRQLQKLTLELSQAEERERRHVALILHEDLQQRIAGARFHLNVLRSQARRDPAQQEVINNVDSTLTEVIEESRRLSRDLSPAVLHMNDLNEALQWLAKQVGSTHGLTVHVDVSGEATLQSESLATFLFRAAQEMLFNVIKHARVHEARIRVRRMGRCLCLSVSDQGCGFDPQDLAETTGFGLLSIRERVEMLGGRMRIKSARGKGSRFHIVVPDGQKPGIQDR